DSLALLPQPSHTHTQTHTHTSMHTHHSLSPALTHTHMQTHTPTYGCFLPSRADERGPLPPCNGLNMPSLIRPFHRLPGVGWGDGGSGVEVTPEREVRQQAHTQTHTDTHTHTHTHTHTQQNRKSTRLNSSHTRLYYTVLY